MLYDKLRSVTKGVKKYATFTLRRCFSLLAVSAVAVAVGLQQRLAPAMHSVVHCAPATQPDRQAELLSREGPKHRPAAGQMQSRVVAGRATGITADSQLHPGPRLLSLMASLSRQR